MKNTHLELVACKHAWGLCIPIARENPTNCQEYSRICVLRLLHIEVDSSQYPTPAHPTNIRNAAFPLPRLAP